jgi:hypothetical protein
MKTKGGRKSPADLGLGAAHTGTLLGGMNNQLGP